MADSQLGVRVVSVEESSQAYLADLRPEDIIVRIDGKEIRSIDEFAVISSALKGRATVTNLLIFRNGTPKQLSVYLYSYPILHEWGLEFVPNYELRFAQPYTGREYWFRLGRGFEEVGKSSEALNAYLNALHQVPTDTAIAFKISRLFTLMSQERLKGGALAEGVALLRQAVVTMQKLFDYPLTNEQLQSIKSQLETTLRILREATAQRQIGTPLVPTQLIPAKT